MRRWPAIVAGVFVLGALPGRAAIEAEQPAWREIAWPFPRDGWPAGRAFHCSSIRCDGIEVYVRPKLGFCNCDSGVADDDEVDRVADVDMISAGFVPLRAGDVVDVADMRGRIRAYHLDGKRTAIGIALSRRCDLMVAVAQGKGTAAGVQRAAVEFLASDGMTRWMSAVLNGG